MKICRSCGVELIIDVNWLESFKRANSNLCRTCNTKKVTKWRTNNYEKVDKNRRKNSGSLPMSQNKSCSSYLGIHVAEQVLSKTFKDVEVMPHGNPGFDFFCNHGKKIDVKSGCILNRKYSHNNMWSFHIGKNKIPDYFLCIAFDNRADLNPLYLWLIPGNLVNDLSGISISETSAIKWEEYKLSVNGVVKACYQQKYRKDKGDEV
jgi:hypothetical protein